MLMYRDAPGHQPLGSGSVAPSQSQRSRVRGRIKTDSCGAEPTANRKKLQLHAQKQAAQQLLQGCVEVVGVFICALERNRCETIRK